MAQIRHVILVGPLRAVLAPVSAEIGAFGEDEEPHGVEGMSAGQRARMTAVQLPKAVGEALFVLGPLPAQEDEAVEHHAGAHERDVFYGFFEDDVDVAVHVCGVGDPPEVYPVGVDLRFVSMFQLRSF